MGWDVAVWLFGWLGIFAVLEGLALLKWVPWTTLSEFVWMLEAIRPFFRWVMLFGLAVLLVHLVAQWP